MTSRANLAYYAGLFDGEGCVRIRKRINKKDFRELNCEISLTIPVVLGELYNIYGGGISKAKKRENHKPIYRWSASGRVAYIFLKEIYPYLKEKRKQVLLSLLFFEWRSEQPYGGGNGNIERVEWNTIEFLENQVTDLKNISYENWKPNQKVIYLVGSLRNRAEVIKVTKELEKLDYEIFTSWLAPGESADDKWKEYEQALGRSQEVALKGFAARHVFLFDKEHLDRADSVVLIMPAGKSCFIELGYAIGCGKNGYILYPNGELKDRWDVMTNFADEVFFNIEDLIIKLKE